MADPAGGPAESFGFEVPQGNAADLEAAAQRASWASAGYESHADNARGAIGVATAHWTGEAQSSFSDRATQLIDVFSSNSQVLSRAGALVSEFAAELESTQRVTQQALTECQRCQQQAQALHALVQKYARTALDLHRQATAAPHPQAGAELARQARAAEADGQTTAQAADRVIGELAEWQRRGRQAFASYTDKADLTAAQILGLEQLLQPPKVLPSGARAPAPTGAPVLHVQHTAPIDTNGGHKQITAQDLQKMARFFRTAKGSTLAFAIAQKLATLACAAHGSDLDAPFKQCTPAQWTANLKRVYFALQHGQNINHLRLIEPPFDTNAGFLDPITLLTGFLAGGLASLGVRALADAFGALILDDAADQAGIWSLGWQARGLEAEKLIVPDPEARLPANFPTIDAFSDDGTATSIKTLDLTAPTYERGGAVLSKLKGYINKLADFEGASFDGETIRRSAIERKELDLGIPNVTPTAAQADAIADAIEYAATKGVIVKVVVIP